jgi:hypothetical protein
MCVVHCVEHRNALVCCLVLGTKKHDEAGSATSACGVHDGLFYVLDLQCHCNELNFLQENFRGCSPLYLVAIQMTRNKAAHTCSMYPHLYPHVSLLCFVQ